jgi:hypothetical protein
MTISCSLLSFWFQFVPPAYDWIACQSQSHNATDGQSVSKSWCRAPSGAVWQLRSCFCGAPSLTGGRVSFMYMLLVLTSAVFLGSKSLGTRDHILLTQIWDFPFRRLLWLAGSRWRYSTPPPHGFPSITEFTSLVSLRHWPRRKHNSIVDTCLPNHCIATVAARPP